MAEQGENTEGLVSWNNKLKPVLQMADAIMRGEEVNMADLPEEVQADMGAMKDAPPADEPMAEEPMAEEPMDANAENVDLAPIEAVVGGPEAAARIWQAASQRDDLAAMTPQELADAIEQDFQLLMELEKLAAQAEGGGDAMPMEEMPPPDMMAAGPDMGMGMGAPAGNPGNPGGGMMPGGY